MERFWNFLEQVDGSLFYKRFEKDDVRFGEVVEAQRERFSDEFKFVIIGFPFDEGAVRNRGRAGASSGPTEIRRAFYKLTPTKTFSVCDAETLIFDAGDIKSSLGLEEALHALEDTVDSFLSSKMVPIVLGGSNDMSYADFKGCTRAFGRCGAINIDSHLDVRDYSKRINSGTPYRMLLDDGALHGEDFVEYAIQEFSNARDHLSFVTEMGSHIFSLSDIRLQSNSKAFRDAYHRAMASATKVYVSFDIDSVRSSDAPGVSAPTPTGLSAEEILECAFAAGSEPKTAMIDICEMNPRFDIDGHTAKLAAMIAANFLAGVSNRKQKRRVDAKRSPHLHS